MNNFISNYTLEFSHPSKKILYELKSRSTLSNVAFDDFISFDKNSHLHSVKTNTSIEESGDFVFVDVIHDLLSEFDQLEIGGSFIDDYGKGYVNSLAEKQYTSTH